MDFRDFTYITKIADCGSITEAARQLFISQPSISLSIQSLEREIGTPLFQRIRGNLTLTYAERCFTTGQSPHCILRIRCG